MKQKKSNLKKSAGKTAIPLRRKTDQSVDPGKKKRTWRELTASDKAHIALDRFDPLRHGDGMEPILILAKRYGRDPAVITRAIASAFEEGLVKVVATGRPEIKQVVSLEDKLQKRYPRLQRAIVVKSDPIPEDASESYKALADDELHQKLGFAMAGQIPVWGVWAGHRVGLGAGRAVFYTAEAAMQSPDVLRVEGLDLVALCGAVHARAYSNIHGVRMDSDLHIALFSLCVQHDAKLHLVTYPVNEYEKRELTCLGDKEWKKHTPTHALTGLGVLAEGHRFFEWANKSKAADDGGAILGHVGHELRKLVGHCEDIYKKYEFWPVADICNYLFLVENAEFPPAMKKTMQELIDGINPKLLNVSDTQLSEVPVHLLVAGGIRKADALRQILSEEKFQTRVICVDDALAAKITDD